MTSRARNEESAGQWLGMHHTVEVQGHRINADIVDQAVFAGAQFRKLLLVKLGSGSFNAEDLAELSWWHSKSYGLGVDDLMLDPDHAHNHGSRHVNNALSTMYGMPQIELAKSICYDKVSCARLPFEVPMQFAHVRLHDEYLDKPLTEG